MGSILRAKPLSRSKATLPSWFEEPTAPTGRQVETAKPLEPAVAAPAPPPAPPILEGVGYRAQLASWPDEWRERWGVRANALEAAGLPWRAAEQQAFTEVSQLENSR